MPLARGSFSQTRNNIMFPRYSHQTLPCPSHLLQSQPQPLPNFELWSLFYALTVSFAVHWPDTACLKQPLSAKLLALEFQTNTRSANLAFRTKSAVGKCTSLCISSFSCQSLPITASLTTSVQLQFLLQLVRSGEIDFDRRFRPPR